jgi:nitrate/nitrite-specific signal transduction histidine kinase
MNHPLITLFLGKSTKKLTFWLALVFPSFVFSQVHIDSINGSKWPLKKDTAYTLQAIENILEIQLIAEDSTDCNLVYVYKLAGVDEKYVFTKSPQIRYTYLKGGENDFYYGIKEKGKKPKLKKQHIIVEEELSETWWFYPSIVFYILLIIGAVVYFWIIYNLRQTLKLQIVRNRIASDLHDEIGSSLSSIKLDIEKIQTQLDEPKELIHAYLEEVRQTADEIITNLRDTVWTIKSDNDDFLRLVDRINTTAGKLLRNRNIELQFLNELTERHNFKIGMEQRRNVFLIFKEALHNIIKHAEAKQVKISLIPTDKDWIEMSIQDNGKGFIVDDKFEGNGLQNFVRRAAESFFKFKMQSTLGTGTHIRVLIPKL